MTTQHSPKHLKSGNVSNTETEQSEHEKNEKLPGGNSTIMTNPIKPPTKKSTKEKNDLQDREERLRMRQKAKLEASKARIQNFEAQQKSIAQKTQEQEAEALKQAEIRRIAAVKSKEELMNISKQLEDEKSQLGDDSDQRNQFQADWMEKAAKHTKKSHHTRRSGTFAAEALGGYFENFSIKDSSSSSDSEPLQTHHHPHRRRDSSRTHESRAPARNPTPLPKFSGDPAEWISFIAFYNNTTERELLDDLANLSRLHEALKGPAHHAVSGLLVHPQNVTKVLQVLQLNFGKARFVVEVMIRKVKEATPVNIDRPRTIIEFSTLVTNLSATLNSIHYREQLQNEDLIQAMAKKLPAQYRLEWARESLRHRRGATVKHFSEYLEMLAEAASEIVDAPMINNQIHSPSRNKTSSHQYTKFQPAPKRQGPESHWMNTHQHEDCQFCYNGYHPLQECRKFQELEVNDRWEAVKGLKRCFNCLNYSHPARECLSSNCCNSYQNKHHDLLHEEYPTQFNQGTQTEHHCHISKPVEGSSILYKILPVTLYGNGTTVQTLAFFDEGSSITMMEQSLADKLKIAGKPNPLCLHWTSNTRRMEEESRSLTVKISGDSSKVYDLHDVHTVKDLSLPEQQLNANDLKNTFKHLKNIPIRSFGNARPEILIGLNHSHLGTGKTISGSFQSPSATHTQLGWVIFGHVANKTSEEEHNHIHVSTSNIPPKPLTPEINCKQANKQLDKISKKHSSPVTHNSSITKISQPRSKFHSPPQLQHSIRNNVHLISRFIPSLLDINPNDWRPQMTNSHNTPLHRRSLNHPNASSNHMKTQFRSSSLANHQNCKFRTRKVTSFTEAIVVTRGGM